MKKQLLIMFLIAIVLELTLFNFNSYRVLDNKSVKEYKSDDFIKYDTDGNVTYIEIDNIGVEIKTIHIQLDVAENVDYQILYTDRTSSNFRGMPVKKYLEEYENSKYVPCYLSGESKIIGIRVASSLANIEKVTINEKIPLDFNIARLIVVFGIMTFIYLLKTREMFKIPYSDKNLYQEIVLIIVLFIFIMVTLLISEYSKNPDEEFDYYTKDFVESLSKGQLYLEQKPSEAFLKLENPYDDGERVKQGMQRGKDFIWDSAYYDGKFYVYFGILPALMMLPYHLITGEFITTATAVLWFSIATAISLKALVKNLFNRFFEEVPFKFMVFSLFLVLFGSQILWLNGIPRFYELSIISALFFAVTGINFMFVFLKKEDKRYRYMFLCCLFLSLSVACRPTQLFTSLIILPVLLQIFIQNIKEKKNIIKNILAVAIPYGFVGISLMIYNYVRFKNILEFGASYQLTINDMSHLGNRFMTLGMGIVCSLFSIPHFLPNFPFMQYHNNLLTFYGYYYIENVMGGLFAMVPICLFIFGIYKVWKRTENKRLLYFTITLIAVGMFMCLISIYMGGSMQRYMVDYAWILIFAGICVFLELCKLYEHEETKAIMRKLFGIITIYVILINLCSGIVSEKSYMQEHSPDEYQKLKYTINFWE